MKKLVVIAFLLLVSKQFAQDLPNVVPPSPEAQAFQKYGDIPVSYYTGVPNISIPLYSLSEGDITVPVSLSYHASGIKVAEEASRVGLGWVLQTGGMISRTVVGEDDFLETFPHAYHNGYENSGTPVIEMGNIGPFQVPSNNVQWADSINIVGGIGSLNLPADATDSVGEVYDFQPDQYSFNFMGYSGNFILKPNKEVVLASKKKIKIKCMDGEASSWEIWTPDGMHYIFAEIETYNQSNFPVKSTWLLTKIISPKGHDISFTYGHLDQQYVKSLGSYTEVNSEQHWVGCCTGGTYPRASKDEPAQGKEYSQVRLDSIISDLGLVEFHYGNRDDLQGDTKIDSITISRRSGLDNNYQRFRAYHFGFEYFVTNLNGNYVANGNGNTGYQSKRRLKLKSVQEKGYKNNQVFTKPPYLFKYHEGVNLPPKTSFSRDHWGYYNGKGNYSLIPSFTTFQDVSPESLIGLMGPQRDTDPNFLKAGTLSEIIYPTGGRTLFEYEANDYDRESSNIDESSYTAPYSIKSDFVKYDANQNSGIISKVIDLSDAYHVVNGHGLLDIKVDFRLSNYNCSTASTNQNATVRLFPIDENGAIPTDPIWSASISSATCSDDYPFLRYEDELQFEPREYLWQAEVGNPIFNKDSITDVTMYHTYPSTDIPESNTQKIYYAGGLRIKKIIEKDNLDPDNDIVTNYDYHYREDRNQDGILEEYSSGVLMVYPRYSYFENSLTNDESVTYLVRSSESNIPLMGTPKANIVGYSEVSVFKSNGEETGKTVYKFHNIPNTVIKYDVQSSAIGGYYPNRPPVKPLIGNRLNGLLAYQLYYKKVGDSYQIVKSVHNDYQSPNLPYGDNVYFGMELRRLVTSEASLPYLPDVAFIYPAMVSYFTDITEIKERLYDLYDINKYTEIVTTYEYDYSTHLQLKKKTIITSSEDSLSTEYEYALDYPQENPVNDKMVDYHMMSLPIIEETTHNGNSSIQFNKYNNFGPNAQDDIINQINYQQDLILTETIQTSKNGVNGTNSLEDRLVFSRYDEHGNPLEVAKAGGSKICYIWGYSKEYPVAKIENVDYSVIESLLGFETDFDLGDNGLSASQENTLRTHASMAQAMVTTYSYEPLVGVTSMTDPRGYTINYVYDEFNRLKEVRDAEDNLVTDYKYHYKGQNQQ